MLSTCHYVTSPRSAKAVANACTHSWPKVILIVAMHRSNEFAMEWPPRSGQVQRYPEVDRAAWFDIEIARSKILASQAPLLDALEALLHAER